MKTINNYIIEKLKITKNTKIHNAKMNKQEIIDYVLAFMGYNNYIDTKQNTDLCNKISEIVSKWIDDFKIESINKVWIVTETDVMYIRLIDRVKKYHPNINLQIVKQVDDNDEENDLMIHIIDGAQPYDSYVSGNVMGLCFECYNMRIGFMTGKNID